MVLSVHVSHKSQHSLSLIRVGPFSEIGLTHYTCQDFWLQEFNQADLRNKAPNILVNQRLWFECYTTRNNSNFATRAFVGTSATPDIPYLNSIAQQTWGSSHRLHKALGTRNFTLSSPLRLGYICYLFSRRWISQAFFALFTFQYKSHMAAFDW